MNLKEHYQQLFKEHGNSPSSVQYSDKNSQFKRFEILYEVDSQMKSVADVGCGLGHFYEFASAKNNNLYYLGLDFVPEFIEASNINYKDNEKVTFQELNLITDAIPKGNEYVVLSGVFNNLMENNAEFMLNSIIKMFDAATKGIAFNAMSTYVDFQSPDLYYSNPLEIFDFCKKELSRKVTLRHDYLVKENSIPFEYAIYVYK